jgi:hypothetical protein
MVVAMDLNPENVDAVEAGELLYDIGGHWLQGGFALVMMYDYLSGEPLPAEVANVKLDLLPLIQATVPQFREDFPGGVPDYNFQERSRVFNPEAETAVFELQYSKDFSDLFNEFYGRDDLYTAPAAETTEGG